MKTLPLSKLKEQYEFVCNEYAVKFANKQGLDFDGWVSDDIGSIGCFGDHFFNLHDIVYDCNSKQQKGLIIEWQNDSVENNPRYINYWSYSKGLRYSDLNE